MILSTDEEDARRARLKRLAVMVALPLRCWHCGVEFLHINRQVRYCSKECRVAARKVAMAMKQKAAKEPPRTRLQPENLSAEAENEPAMFGDKVQIESRSLVINTNLDFGIVERFDKAQNDARSRIPPPEIRSVGDTGQYMQGDLSDVAETTTHVPALTPDAAEEPSGLASCASADRRARAIFRR